MTREEAIERINDIRKIYARYVEIITENENEALDMAIEALKKNESAEEWYKLFVEKLEQEPTEGHWIKYQEPWGGTQKWKCSNCGNSYDIHRVYTIMPYNYCPNCGKKMESCVAGRNNRW